MRIFQIRPNRPSLGRWNRTHDYDVWTQCLPLSAAPLTLWEGVKGGVLHIPDNDTVMHIIKGGTPHHIAGLFGYWRISDSDIVWFRMVRQEWVHYAMMLGGCPSAYVNDRIAWICPSCGTWFGEQCIAKKARGRSAFWADEAMVVESFNKTDDSRTCPQCGQLHPNAYSFRREMDNTMSPAAAW